MFPRQLDCQLQFGKNEESKEETSRQFFLFTEQDPIPRFITEAAYPELLRIILLTDETMKSAHLDEAKFKRRDSLKEYASYSEAFRNWLQTADAKRCCIHFSQFFPKFSSQIQKQFSELKEPKGFFDTIFKSFSHREKKYAEDLAMKCLYGNEVKRFVELLKEGDLLSVDAIATICQTVKNATINPDNYYLMISGLKDLKKHNLLTPKNIAYICKVPSMAKENANILFQLPQIPLSQADKKFVLDNPCNAPTIIRHFPKLQETGILEKCREFIYQNIQILNKLAPALTLLHSNNSYERYRKKFEDAVKYNSYSDNILPIAELLVFFEKNTIEEKNREILFKYICYAKEFKSALFSLHEAGILMQYPDLIFLMLSARPKDAENNARVLIELQEKNVLTEKTCLAFKEAVRNNEYLNPDEFLHVLTSFNLLNEENVAAFFNYSRSIATSIYKLNEAKLFTPYKEQLLQAFKKNPRCAASIEYAFFELKELKVPIEEHLTPLFQGSGYVTSFADALINLQKNRMLYKDGKIHVKNYDALLKTHAAHPGYAYMVSVMLVRLKELGSLNKKTRAEVVKKALYAFKFRDCLNYIKASQIKPDLCLKLITRLMNETAHIEVIWSAVKAIGKRYGEVNTDQWNRILDEPRNALFFVKQLEAKFDKDNKGAVDFAKLHEMSKLAAQGMRCQSSLFYKLSTTEVVSKVVMAAAGNGVLDPETRMSISMQTMRASR